MAIEVCVLASGSAGNCTVLRTPAGVLLVDAGIGPVTAGRRMAGTGVAAADVAAVCLTHLDSDHFNPNWLATIVRRGIRVYCHASRVEELVGLARSRGAVPDVCYFGSDPFEPVPGLTAHAIPLAHDRAGSHGFVFEGFSSRVGYATDLGHVTGDLVERFCESAMDVLALESNYDPQMQLSSARPWFLKRRIMGGRGHLSNQQAFEAVRWVLDRCEQSGSPLPAHILLLHRSRQCNCPQVLRRLFDRDRRIAPRLTLAEQYQRTEWLRPGPGAKTVPIRDEQLTLFGAAVG